MTFSEFLINFLHILYFFFYVYLFIFFGFFLDFLNFSVFFKDFFGFSDFLIFFGNFKFFCLDLIGFFSKLLQLLLNLTEVTTEHQEFPKINTNSVKSSFFTEGEKMPRPKAKAQSPKSKPA